MNQERSRAVNGLDAVNVARPGKYGNQFTVTECGSRQQAVNCFNGDMAMLRAEWPMEYKSMMKSIALKILACWCGEGPCHADVLLDFANIGLREDGRIK